MEQTLVPLDQIIDPLVEDLFRMMLQLGRYQDVIHLMCTCRHLCNMGKPLLTQELHRLELVPCSNEINCFEMCDYQEWLDLERNIHRDGDLPAIITKRGTLLWYQHGLPHRGHDRPTIIRPDGTREWYSHGFRHRENDHPSVILVSGTQIWCYGGCPSVVSAQAHEDCIEAVLVQTHEYCIEAVIHRECDRPAIIEADGTQKWYHHGRLHREGDQPAIIYPNGRQDWFIKGQRHREDFLPAVILPDGSKEYWQDGQQFFLHIDFEFGISI